MVAAALSIALLESHSEARPAQRLTHSTSDFVLAVQMLSANGLADPRGGQYKRVTLTVRNSLRDEKRQIETSGWVFTFGQGNEHYAVCWDGLLYKVDSVGKAANIADDIKERPPAAGTIISFDTRVADAGWPSFRPRTLVGAALLARAQENIYADDVLTDFYRYIGGTTLSRMANDLVLSLFHRGVAEYIAGNDSAAVRELDKAEQLRRLVQNYLDRLPEQARREIYDFRPPTNIVAIRDAAVDRLAYPNKIERDWSRVAERDKLYQLLLRFVEIGGGNRFGVTGRPNLVLRDLDAYLTQHPEPPSNSEQFREYTSWVYSGLGLVVEDQVPKLVEIARTEKYTSRRLNPDWQFSRFGPGTDPRRTFATAAEVANQHIEAIVPEVETEGLAGDGTAHGKVLEYWERYGSYAIPERLLKVTEDLSRPPVAWIASLSRLTAVYQYRDEPARLAFETFLTDDRARSLLSLIEARCKDINLEAIPRMSAYRLAQSVYRLDTASSLPYLRAAMRNASGRQPNDPGMPPHAYAEITVLRLQLGDKGAVEEYVLQQGLHQQEGRLDLNSEHIPLVLFPEIPEFEKDLIRRFELQLQRHCSGGRLLYGHASDFGPYLVCEPLRPRIAELLTSDEPGGLAKIEEIKGISSPDDEGRYRFMVSVSFTSVDGNKSGSTAVREVTKADMSLIGTERRMRMRDHVAYSLALAGFGPGFELFWSEERRDRAIEEYRKLVLTETFRIRDANGISMWTPWWYSREPVRLRGQS